MTKQMANQEQYDINILGKASYDSPLRLSKRRGDDIFNFVKEDDKILHDISLKEYKKCLVICPYSFYGNRTVSRQSPYCRPAIFLCAAPQEYNIQNRG